VQSTVGQHLKKLLSNMQHVKENNKVPESSIILKNFGEVNYYDSYQVLKNTDDSIDKITTIFFCFPIWVDFLLRLRNLIVGVFGLKNEDEKSVADYYPIGSKAVMFTVIDRNDNEIVMAENDKHLNFRLSVQIERTETQEFINVNTIVKFNNLFGKLYFLPLKPFHKIIIKSLLNKTL
jgi:hypothetical protein